MKFWKWLSNICWLIMWGQSGQPQPAATPAAEPAELTPAQKRRQAQLAWQQQLQSLISGSSGNFCISLPLAADSPHLPEGLALNANGLIDARCVASCDEHRGTANPLPAILSRKLLAEALPTPRGQFAVAKQAAAEVCAKELGFDLNDPAVLDKVPAYLRPHVRYIPLQKDG